MTAFAAVLTRDGARLEQGSASRIAAALRIVSGTAPTLVWDGCALISSTIHPGLRSDPLVHQVSGVAVTGQVLLEGAHPLARELGLPPGASDLDVIAGAYSRWGTECTKHLAGEFAFVLWDPRTATLLAARDGLGLRLIYAAEGPHCTVFTNVLAAALAAPGISDALDDVALIEFLASGAADDGRTPFRAVKVIPAGHTVTLVRDIRAASLTRHWWFPHRRDDLTRWSRQDIVDRYRTLLETAVADRLRTKSAAILMSGGIDSTTIAAAARSTTRDTDLRAFTAVYERLPLHDELAFARAAADRLRIPLTPVRGDSYEALEHLDSGRPLPMPLDEPTLSDWRLLLGTAARHAPVALYGEDGDTLFAAPGWRELTYASGCLATLAAAGRHLLQNGRLPYLGIRLRERLGLTPKRRNAETDFLTLEARRILGDRGPATVFGQAAEPLPPHSTRAFTQSLLCTGAARFLAPLAAPEVTGAPIELRCPLLDSRVVQFVVDLPAIPWCQRKFLPRLAYRDEVPDAVLDRPKQSVRGLDELLVAAWRQRGQTRRFAHSPVSQWVDTDQCDRALQRGTAFEAGLAWRVLQLDAWLTRRRTSSDAPMDDRCTA